MDRVGQDTDQRTRGLEMPSEKVQESPAFDHPDGRVVQGEGCGRPVLVSQDSKLSEELWAVEGGQQLPVGGDRYGAHFDPPLPEEQHVFGLVALEEQVAATAVLPDVSLIGKVT